MSTGCSADGKRKALKMKYKKSVYQSIAMVTQFGINMLVPVCACSYAGMYLDKKLGTGFLMIVFFFIGALSGFRNIYVLARRIYEKKEKEEVHAKKNKTVK